MRLFSHQAAKMELRQLRYFVAIVDAGSLTKAAERVYVAQPALSQQLSALEKEFATPLLVRSYQGVTPTPAGRVLYRHARSVLRQLGQVHREVLRADEGESGPVALGLPATISSIVALPLIKALRDRHPGIHLHLFESMGGYLAELLAHGRLDMCVLFRDTETPGIGVHMLFDEGLFVVGGPLGCNGATCAIKELDGVSMVLPSVAHGLRNLVERGFLGADAELNVIADLDSFPALVRVAASGLAHTVLPWSALPEGFATDHSVRLLVERQVFRPVSLCWSTSLPRTAASMAVQDILIELIEELIREQKWVGAKQRPPNAVEQVVESIP